VKKGVGRENGQRTKSQSRDKKPLTKTTITLRRKEYLE